MPLIQTTSLYTYTLYPFPLFFRSSSVTQFFMRSTYDGLPFYKPALLTLTLS